MWGAFSDERTSLSFTIAVGLHQNSHVRARVLRDVMTTFYSLPYIVTARTKQHIKHSFSVLLTARITRCQATIAVRTTGNTSPVLFAACVSQALPSSG
jgi:hypothetical protein